MQIKKESKKTISAKEFEKICSTTTDYILCYTKLNSFSNSKELFILNVTEEYIKFVDLISGIEDEIISKHKIQLILVAIEELLNYKKDYIEVHVFTDIKSFGEFLTEF